MSTSRLLPSGTRARARGGIASAGRAARSAFTLIELLVVIAIIALLISILLPSLRGAREQARAAVCGQRLRDMGTGLASYTTNNEDWLPGVNTSGVVISVLKLKWPSEPTLLYQSRMPVQTFDWLTPIMAPNLELPAIRAKRFKFLLETFGCPSQRYTSTLYEAGSTSPDVDAFKEELPFRTISYLMPAAFQYFGDDYEEHVLGWFDFSGITKPVKPMTAPGVVEVRSASYLPQTGRVGPPARKIFVADGTRYLEIEGGLEALDFDAYPKPDYYGSFATSGAWWGGSVAYGVAQGTLSWDGYAIGYPQKGQGKNLALTYRHGGRSDSLTNSAQANDGSINALFFDGHVDRITDRQSREISLWYPAGSVVLEYPNDGMTYVPEDFVVP